MRRCIPEVVRILIGVAEIALATGNALTSGNPMTASDRYLRMASKRAPPRRLLTEAEIRALAPGDRICDRYGVWYEITQVYAASRAPIGVLKVMFHAQRVDAPKSTWTDYAVGPLYLTGHWSHGTRRSHVRFAPREMARAA